VSVSEGFLQYVLDQLSTFGGVTARRMFGGAGLYRDGKMFCLIADDVAYLKADDTNRARFEESGSLPFRPYPNRPTVMPYFEIPPGVLEDAAELSVWAEAARRAVAKARPRRGRKQT
jgi:DNA transformation protein and related proteins